MADAARQLNTLERATGIEALSAPLRGETPRFANSAIFVTSSSEYEVRDGVCWSVRDRDTGAWRPKHRAIGMRLVRVPQAGQILHLAGDSFAVLMTSIVEEVRKPASAGQLPQRTRPALVWTAR